jgi:SRSO17 transposase
LTTLVQVAGLRWSVEDCFETAKTACGLDQYEVRNWEPWHRHIALSMVAFAFLSLGAARTARAADARETTERPSGSAPVIATSLPPQTPD